MHLTTEATPTTSPPGPPTAPSSRTAAPAAMCLFCLLASATIACSEYSYYHRALDLPPLPLPATASLFWALTAKTLALLSPALLLATTLSTLRLPRLAWATFTIASLALVLFLLSDLQSQRQAGIHLLDLLHYALFPNAGQVGGGTTGILTQALLVLLPTTLAALTTLYLCSKLTRHLPSPLPKRWHLPALALTYSALTLGVIPAQLWFPSPHVKILQRLYASLPVRAEYLAAGSLVGDTESFSVPLNRYLLPTLRQLGDPIAPRPADTRPLITDPNPPNLVIVCCDSLRADALTPDRMPRLYAYAQKGLWLRHHYAQANTSHTGIFTLLYGRSCAAYYPTLDAHVLPQLNSTLALAGYRRTYFSPMQYLGWARMEEYISPQTFDDSQITTTSFDIADRILLHRTQALLQNPPDHKPQFVLAFLSSTHYPYVYPSKGYDIHTPAVSFDQMMLRSGQFTSPAPTFNRYLNAARYEDDAVADFLDSVDLTRTIVVLTGDHGESLWQDGSLTHGTRPSDVQTRVPCFLLGPNVPARAVDQWTGHTDLLPTLLHAITGHDVGLLHTDGRDLLKPTKSPAPNVLPQFCIYKVSDHVTIDLFAPDGRIRVQVDRRRPNVSFAGTIDPRGNVDAFQAPPAHTAQAWARRLERVLRRMRN